MKPLHNSWRRAWGNLQLAPPDGLIDKLLAAYMEAQRHYHCLQHLQECLSHFEGAAHLAAHPGEVELALWFHDAIYDVKGKTNELQSAQWASSELAAAGASPSVIQRVHELIMATRHDASPTDSEPDQQLLVDIDLAILGAAPERFQEYTQQVRAEYSWVPGLIYRINRARILKGFLKRPSIYGTRFFRDRFEAQARDNLRKR